MCVCECVCVCVCVCVVEGVWGCETIAAFRTSVKTGVELREGVTRMVHRG